MQISKTRSRNGSPELPVQPSSATIRSRQPTKLVGSASRTQSAPVGRSRSAKTMATEKRRPSTVSELECQLVQLQEELKRTKDQLRQAQQEADAAKHHLAAMSAKLQDSKSQIVELSEAEDARIQELRKISQERDRAWQFELEAMQKQHSIDSSALASAMDELQRLKRQLQAVRHSESELARKSEVDRLQVESSRQDLADALVAMDGLRVQLQSSERAEAEAKFTVAEMKKQLGIAQGTIDSLLADGSKLMESFSILAVELKESRLRVRSLEQTTKKLQEESSNATIAKSICFNASDDDEVEEFLIKHEEEQIQSLVRSQCAYESMEKMITDFKLRESELESSLNNARSEVTRLESKLFDREAELLKNTQTATDVAVSDLKSQLAEKAEENEHLKAELKNAQMNSMKLGYLFEEEPTSAQAEKSEMKAELRKLKVQAEQWRKAAETAIVMLTADGAADLEMHLPFSDDLDDQPSRKKKNNVLRRISDKWNKDHK